MKQLLIILFTLLSLMSTSFSQVSNSSDSLGKLITIGCNIGLNQSLLITSSTEVNSLTNIGGRLGITSNYKFSSIFSIAPKLELSFNNAKIVYREEINSKFDFFPMARNKRICLTLNIYFK